MPMVVQPLRELHPPVLRKLPKVCGLFVAALAVRATVLRPLTYGGRPARYANELEAKSKHNPPDLENQFLHRWMLYCTDRNFERAFFKEKRIRDH
jgi:hypothetical protein